MPQLNELFHCQSLELTAVTPERCASAWLNIVQTTHCKDRQTIQKLFIIQLDTMDIWRQRCCVDNVLCYVDVVALHYRYYHHNHKCRTNCHGITTRHIIYLDNRNKCTMRVCIRSFQFHRPNYNSSKKVPIIT
jgi:hypothetical protein